MAPQAPPPASLPLQERLLKMAQTLQFAWFCGHVTLLFSALRYFLSYIRFNYYSGMAQFTYRTSFLAAAVTYGIVVFKAFRSRTRQGRPTGGLTMLGDENVQYLLMAVVWLFSRQIPLAILPFSVYSVFHVITYTRANLLPIIQPQAAATAAATGSAGSQPKKTTLADRLGKFVKDYYDSSMTLVAWLEMALWFRVAGSALLFQRGSWVLLLLYTAFFRARFDQSSFVQGAIAQLTARVDAQVANQSVPPAVRQAWAAAKRIARQAADATDVSRYVAGKQGAAGPKKAQ